MRGRVRSVGSGCVFPSPAARRRWTLFAKRIVYLRVDCSLSLLAIGLKVAPDAVPASFEHDSENVYEWIYVTIRGLPFALSLSREHGWADLEDDLLDTESTVTQEELEALVRPGPVYIFGWNRSMDAYVDHLPDWLPQFAADRLLVDVLVYNRRINVDLPDGEPFASVCPQERKRK